MKRVKVIYAAGPGDISGSFDNWRNGTNSSKYISNTYSGQFFDACRNIGAEALVIGCGSSRRCEDHENFKIMVKKVPFEHSKSSLLFHLGQWWYGIWLFWKAVRYRADVAIVTQGTHWHMLSLMAIYGIHVVPSLHTAFWPRGSNPRISLAKRCLRCLDRLFWRHSPWAVLVLSGEVERQLRIIAGDIKCPIFRWRIQFSDTLYALADSTKAPKSPFRVVYSGRIERSKGVFDLLETAGQLESLNAGAVRWEICGDGSATEEFVAEVRSRGLESVIKVHGWVDGLRQRTIFERSHAAIVPTASWCSEGYARSAAESVIAGLPVILSDVVPAIDDLTSAAVEVRAGDIEGYTAAILSLAMDSELYEKKLAACNELRVLFRNSRHSWGAAVECLLRAAKSNINAHDALGEFLQERKDQCAVEGKEMQHQITSL